MVRVICSVIWTEPLNQRVGLISRHAGRWRRTLIVVHFMLWSACSGSCTLQGGRQSMLTVMSSFEIFSRCGILQVLGEDDDLMRHM